MKLNRMGQLCAVNVNAFGCPTGELVQWYLEFIEFGLHVVAWVDDLRNVREAQAVVNEMSSVVENFTSYPNYERAFPLPDATPTL